MDFLEKKSLLNQNQHGFRRGRGCLSQLLEHHDRILDALEDSAGVDVIYLDLWKAFDQVDHGIVLHKARALGLTGKVISWLQAFLSERTQTVVVEGCSSSESEVPSGVPQGSVLGPVLFLLLLGDIDGTITNSVASSFADDTKLIGSINGISSVSKIQKDLENLYGWADKNNMKFNSHKFQSLRYRPQVEDTRLPAYIAYDGTEIEECKTVKDLGVLMSNDLSFSAQVNEVVTAARSQVAWILRTFPSRNTELMMTLFRALVLPRLEYCSLLWSPRKIGEVEALEGVQRTFTSRIPALAHLDYWERLSALELYSVERRRERFALLYIHKIIRGVAPNVNNKIKTYQNARRGLLCNTTWISFRAPTTVVNARMECFAYRGSLLFNCLPRELRELESVTLFKSRLDRFLRSVPDQPHAHQYHRRASSNSIIDQLATMRADGIFHLVPMVAGPLR